MLSVGVVLAYKATCVGICVFIPLQDCKYQTRVLVMRRVHNQRLRTRRPCHLKFAPPLHHWRFRTLNRLRRRTSRHLVLFLPLDVRGVHSHFLIQHQHNLIIEQPLALAHSHPIGIRHLHRVSYFLSNLLH